MEIRSNTALCEKISTSAVRVFFTEHYNWPMWWSLYDALSQVKHYWSMNELMQLSLDKHGIQLHPDIVELSDDVKLISDTVSGLQNQLNIIRNTISYI